VSDIWGKSDVYRTYKEGGSLPEGCTALVRGQPLLGRKHDDAPNPKLEPLPVAWFKYWQTSEGKKARVFQSTMGSGHDLESAGLRRLVINAAASTTKNSASCRSPSRLTNKRDQSLVSIWRVAPATIVAVGEA
jgi:hypothetical protein